MLSLLSIFDAYEELAIERYLGGIQLVKQERELTNASLSHLYNQTFSISFIDVNSRFVSGNEGTAEMVGAISKHDIHGRTPDNFWNESTSAKFIENNKAVFRSGLIMVLDKSGLRHDQSQLHAISFKFPWYFNGKKVGIFDCSLHVEPESLGNLSINMAKLLSAGLLAPDFQLPTRQKIPLSQRENQVLMYLARGHTAKAIASILQLSPRTIEHHIENIKIKSNCSSKTQLIRKYYGEN